MTQSEYHNMSKRDHCYFCGAFGGLEEHHIIPQRFGGPDTQQNIVALCGSCHAKIERLYDKAFYEWFGIDDEAGERKFHRSCLRDDCSQMGTVEVVMPRGNKIIVCDDHANKILDRFDHAEVWEEADE